MSQLHPVQQQLRSDFDLKVIKVAEIEVVDKQTTKTNKRATKK